MRSCINYRAIALPQKDPPADVVHIMSLSIAGIPMGIKTYNKIFDYPEWFPEENEYRRRWNTIPEKEIDEYYEVAHKIDWDRTDYPYPELAGLGIVGTAEAMYNPETKHMVLANDKYMAKKFEEDRKRTKELFNKMFNKYGIKEE